MSRRARHSRSSEDESSPTHHHQHEHEATSPESPSHSHSHSPSQDDQDQDYVTDDNASTSRTKVKQEDKTRHHGHCPSCSNRFAFHTGSAHVKCPYCSISIAISSLVASSDTSSSSPPSTSKSSSNSNSSSSAAKMQAEQKRFYNILGDFKDHFDKNNSALVWLARASPTRSWKLAIPKACRWPKANAGQGGYALAFRRCGLVLRETDTKSGHWHSWYLDPKKSPLKPLQAALMQRWKESAHFSEQAAELCSMMHGRHNSMNPMVPIPLHDETDFVARDWKHLLGNIDSAKEFNERLMHVRANMRTHFANRSHAMGLEYMKGVTQTQPQQLQHTGTTLASQPINIHHNNQAVSQLAAATPSTPSALPTTPIPAGPNVSGSATLPTPPSTTAFHPFLNGHNMFPGLMNGTAASLPPHLQAALASASMPAPTMINPQHMMTSGWMELLQQQAQAQAQAQQQQQQQQQAHQQAQQQVQQAQSQASVITPDGIARMSSDPSSSLPTNMNMSFPFMPSFDPSNPVSASQPSMQQLLMLQQAMNQSGNPFPFQAQTQTQAPQPAPAPAPAPPAPSPSHPMFPFDPSTWLQAGLARATSQPTTAAAQQQSQAQALAIALAAAQAQAAQAQAAQAQAQAQAPTTQDWAAAAAAAFSSAATSSSSAPLLPPNFASFLPPNTLALSSLFQSPPPPSASSTNTSFSNNFPSPMTTTATSTTTTADPSSSNNSVSSNNTPIPTSRSLEALVNAQAHLVAMASHSHSNSPSSTAPSNTISESTSIPTYSHASSFRPMNSHAVPSPLRPNPSPSQSRSSPSPPSSKSISATTSSRFAPSPVTIPSSMVASHSTSNLSSHSNMTSPATSSSSSPAPLLQSMSATAQ